MSQVIVINDLSNLGEQLKAALAGSGIDASQFGDIGVQIQKALADAGVGPQMVSGVVEAPPAVEPESPAFGELLDSDSDEVEFNSYYNVKNAASIELTFNSDGDLELALVSKDGEESFDNIEMSELDGSRVNAYVEDDTLVISIPKIHFPNVGDSVSIVNFNPNATVEAEEDSADLDDAEEDGQGEWCDVCNEYHKV